VVWTADSKQALLLINDHPEAVFNFEAKRGYCRTGFPHPTASWSKHSHEWDETAVKAFGL